MGAKPMDPRIWPNTYALLTGMVEWRGPPPMPERLRDKVRRDSKGQAYSEISYIYG